MGLTQFSLVLVLVMAVATTACRSNEQRRAGENEALQKEAATEIGRICSLPPAEREAELNRIKDESGMVLYCGKQ